MINTEGPMFAWADAWLRELDRRAAANPDVDRLTHEQRMIDELNLSLAAHPLSEAEAPVHKICVGREMAREMGRAAAAHYDRVLTQILTAPGGGEG